MELPQYINSKKFLPNGLNHGYPINCKITGPDKFDFSGTDSESRYRTNCKKMPEDWLYHTKPISYTLNSEGYRAPEFDTIDWSNSVVLFGCSCVYGVGLDDSDTISAQLEKLIGIPVINVGAPASSIQFSYYNQLILANIAPKPKAVINIWTSSERISVFTDLGAIPLGPWPAIPIWCKQLLSLWNFSEINPAVHSYILQQSARIFWKNIPHCEYSFFDHTADQFKINTLPVIDRARDIRHPGINSARLAAEKIAEDLIKILN
jgi:hypothetical protein